MPLFKDVHLTDSFSIRYIDIIFQNTPRPHHTAASAGQPLGMNDPTYSDGATAAGRGGEYAHFGNSGAAQPLDGTAGAPGLGADAGARYANAPLPGVGAGVAPGPGNGAGAAGTGSGTGSISGKVEHVVGTLIGSESLKAKGIAKER